MDAKRIMEILNTGYSIQQEAEMEEIIELLPCQNKIMRVKDVLGRGGVSCYCAEENIRFYSLVYLSKLNIMNTCNARCLRFQDKLNNTKH